MLPTLVLVVALSAGDPADTPTQPTLTPPAAPEEAVKFDELPVATPRVGEDQRVQRFLGAFAGGLVGLGGMLALMPLADSAIAGCFGCVNGMHVVLGAAAPVVSVTAAWAVFSLLGGDAGPIAPWAAMLPAVTAGLLLANISRDVDAQTLVAQLPFVVAAGFFLAGGSALALDLRSRQLDALGTARHWGGAAAGRVAVTSLVSALTSSVGALISGLLMTFNPFLGITAALVQTLGVAATSYGVHHAMKGKGTLSAALAGMGLGTLVTLGCVGLYALSQSSFSSFNLLRNSGAAVLTVEVGIVAALFAPMVALELSHTSEVEAALPKFSVGAAPVRDGAMVSAGMRF